jgi:hypothetical protein
MGRMARLGRNVRFGMSNYRAGEGTASSATRVVGKRLVVLVRQSSDVCVKGKRADLEYLMGAV